MGDLVEEEFIIVLASNYIGMADVPDLEGKIPNNISDTFQHKI